MSLLKQLLKVYVLVAYVIMGLIAYKCYDAYKRERAYAKKVETTWQQLNSNNLWQLAKATVNEDNPNAFKLRDQDYIEALHKEVLIAFVLAPLAIPYYLVVKEGKFPKY